MHVGRVKAVQRRNVRCGGHRHLQQPVEDPGSLVCIFMRFGRHIASLALSGCLCRWSSSSPIPVHTYQRGYACSLVITPTTPAPPFTRSHQKSILSGVKTGFSRLEPHVSRISANPAHCPAWPGRHLCLNPQSGRQHWPEKPPDSGHPVSYDLLLGAWPQSRSAKTSPAKGSIGLGVTVTSSSR